MGLFDFLKSKPAGPSLETQQALASAIEVLVERPSDAAKAAFEKALANAVLFLGVREVPSSIGPGANQLEEDVEVAVLESSLPSGERVLFAFTTPQEVHMRNPDASIIARPSRDVLEMVVEGGFDLLAIDPSGIVIELKRPYVESLLGRT